MCCMSSVRHFEMWEQSVLHSYWMCYAHRMSLYDPMFSLTRLGECVATRIHWLLPLWIISNFQFWAEKIVVQPPRLSTRACSRWQSFADSECKVFHGRLESLIHYANLNTLLSVELNSTCSRLLFLWVYQASCALSSLSHNSSLSCHLPVPDAELLSDTAG